MIYQRWTLFLLVSALSSLVIIEAIPTPKSCLEFIKHLALEKFKAGLERTAVVGEFRGAIGRIKEKYELAAQQGLFDTSNEDEASKYYYQIALEEMRSMKESHKLEGEIGQLGEIDIPEGIACKRSDGADENADYDILDMDLSDTGAESLNLKNQLDELNLQLESEMGWKMSPEARAAMNKRAKQLAHELLTNEVRDLALAAVTGFMSGGVGGAVGPVWTVVSASLKLKVVQYFMQMLLDVLSNYFGHPIKFEQVPMPNA